MQIAHGSHEKKGMEETRIQEISENSTQQQDENFCRIKIQIQWIKLFDREEMAFIMGNGMLISIRARNSSETAGSWIDSPFDLEAFSDSDYARASLDRKSTTRGCQFLGKRLISWQCKKHTIVANSTTEAEYVAAANCCRQVLWIQNHMLDYGYNLMNTNIYIDNQSTICIEKTKYVKTVRETDAAKQNPRGN
ncbi:hypothetical protein Tco_1245523 [Tanacetum coccineum]